MNLTAGEYRVYTSQRVVVATDDKMPQMTEHLLTVFPNPIADGASIETTIAYALDENAVVDVAVFDMLGRKVANLADGMQSAGEQYLTWNTANLANGTYLVRLSVNGAVETRKIVKM